MDFKVLIGAPGTMTFNPNTDISTSMYMSLSTVKGTWFQDKTFGLEGITKITKSNMLTLKQNAEAALKWLILAGYATKIDVTVEQDLSDINRVDIKATATQANGYVITYQQFYAVGGPCRTLNP